MKIRKPSVPSRLSACVLVAALLAPAAALAQRAAPPTDTAREILITNVMIPMRDGVRLAARVYRPVGSEFRTPAIVTLTPYTSDDAHERARFYAEHGYVYLNVDVRGRGGSEGEFWPLEQDGPDGADVVAWVADQPWSDGQVAMRGGSYRGMTQWQTLRERPAALKTIVPTAAVYPGWDYPHPSGIFLSYAAQWLAFVQGNASQESLFTDGGYWADKFRLLQREGRPFAELDDVTGIAPRVFERWIAHPSFDAYWQSMSPGPEDYRGFDLPILTITGHFDGDQPGAMKYYRDHMRYAPVDAAAKHFLVIGPWNHGGTRHPTRELGGLIFGENSVVDMERLHLAWFDWTLRDGRRPALLEDRVAYYLMGSNEWRYAPSLEAVSNDSRTWYLASPGGGADDVFHSGALGDAPPAEDDVDRYTYDPRRPPREADDDEGGGGYVGGGAAFRPGPKLIYHSAPLDAPLDVAGYATLEAYLELDVPDTDILASIYEVRRDGTTIYLGESMLRARYRHGVDRAVPVEPGNVERYRFDRFYWFARTLREGSRVRLVLQPIDTPYLQKNYNSGGDPMRETPADARTATVRLHLGPDHPSRLILPVAAPRTAVR